MEIINDSKNRICVVTDDRDEFGQCYKTERVIPIEKAIELKKQLSDAIDKAEKQGASISDLLRGNSGNFGFIGDLLEIAADEMDKLRIALEAIRDLDPETDSDEGYNEWGEADCFRQAQKISESALGV